MPLPIILWGAAAALAATGVFKGVEASGNFDKAKEIGEDAERKFKKPHKCWTALVRKPKLRWLHWAS